MRAYERVRILACRVSLINLYVYSRTGHNLPSGPVRRLSCSPGKIALRRPERSIRCTRPKNDQNSILHVGRKRAKHTPNSSKALALYDISVRNLNHANIEEVHEAYILTLVSVSKKAFANCSPSRSVLSIILKFETLER